MRFFLAIIWLSLLYGKCDPWPKNDSGPKEYVPLFPGNKIIQMQNGIKIFTFSANLHTYRIKLVRLKSESSTYNNYNGTVETYNSHFSSRKLVAKGSTDSGYFQGVMTLQGSKYENPDYWFFSQLQGKTIFYTLKEYFGLETGTLLICAKIKYKGRDAILIVGDSIVIKPKAADEATLKKFRGDVKAATEATDEEFRKQISKLQKDALIKYIKDHANRPEGFEKIINLGSINRGIVGVGGERYVYTNWESSLRGELISVTQKDSRTRAADSYQKIVDYIKNFPRGDKGNILLGQIMDGKRKIYQWNYSRIPVHRAPRLGFGVEIKEILTNYEKFAAIGLASWDEDIKQWLGNIFGARNDLNERVFTHRQLVIALSRFANNVHGKYAGVIGKRFTGYVMSDKPAEWNSEDWVWEPKSINKIETDEFV